MALLYPQSAAGDGAIPDPLLLWPSMLVNRSTRLLLIDDDELSRAVLELHFTDAGFAVTEAESGDGALALLRGNEPPDVDVILSDLQMPGLSGPDLARELRTTVPGSVRLIAMSGSEPVGSRVEGFDDFLLKPFTVEEFTTVLRSSSRDEAAAEDGASRGAATGAGAEEVMEEAIFVQLSSMLTPTQLGELFALSFSEMQKHLQRMRKGFENGDATTLHESAHAIKGSFAILGAHELRKLGAQLEAGTGTSADQAATLAEIPGAAERLKRMLTSRGVQFSRDLSFGQETQ